MGLRPRTYRARRLRKEATDAEQKLWQALRELKAPVKVRRQHPIGSHIVDFAIPSRNLVIEIDGGQHATATEADARRTRVLEERGYRVIRFWNSDVLSNLEGVVEIIRRELRKSPTSP